MVVALRGSISDQVGDCPLASKYSKNIEMSEKFEQLIDILKTYHISCKTLDMNTRWAGKGPTKEQCVEVFKLTKPEGINLDSKDSDRFEALATYKATVIPSPLLHLSSNFRRIFIPK